MQKQGYAGAFVMCVFAFIEGILFAFFCFELVQEQFESIADNQSYVDDMKDLYGRPQSMMKNLKLQLGLDWKWWMFPTRPILKLNLYERLYSIK
eukprot:CAMPEP_0170551514 /NCGR_PEP_ID=MMETSP0211-20121228/9512_1 /TAXON_ID=311385 /ORGANISM="Pseudokeronopsis sp., Strain OXSARD2" /LENGTH=93 /DNA_ID=CAMNT_0010858731 /DNA_START=482 /DNA_END=763 /DNA_ORIENTATION=+